MSDDWKAEYEQLSEDFRFYVQMGWQATFAVLIGDALVASYVFPFRFSHPYPFDVAFILAGLFTFLMSWATMKWIVRTGVRVKRLKVLDKEHHFGRFDYDEPWFLSLKIGDILSFLMGAVGIGMALLPLLLIWFPAFQSL